MKLIKTTSGFEAEVNENAADDLAFLDLICAIDDGDPHAMRGLISALLSEEDGKRLIEHVRTEDGRAPVSALNAEISDIIKEIGKNNCSGRILARRA